MPMLTSARASLAEHSEHFDPRCLAAAQRYLDAGARLADPIHWPAKMQCALNLFLWHLDAFAAAEDPRPLFEQAVDRQVAFLDAAAGATLIDGGFPAARTDDETFEEQVSNLFSDIWLGMTDDIYFEEPYRFTRERLEKSGVDPESLFAGKVVVDGGCGSGKFSAAIARFGAAKVIGVDLGERGLEFARRQAAKVPYGDRLEYAHGSLLDIPLADSSVDMVWSNGVIHHTADYEKCVAEFARIIKPGGTLFLYVNGHFGLFELLLDTIRLFMRSVPRALYLAYLRGLGINSGRIYWIADCSYAPYEWKPASEVEAMLLRHGFGDLRQLKRGVASDQIEQVSLGIPFADIKYGEAQLKYLATRVAQ